MERKLGDFDLSLDAILIKVREFDSASKPDLRDYRQVILRTMQRDYRIATFLTIVSRNTGEIKHHALTLRTIRHFKAKGWVEDEDSKITLTDEDGINEFQILIDFLQSVSEVSADGNYFVLNSSNLDSRLAGLLKVVSNSENSLELLSQILNWANTDEKVNKGLVQLASDNPARSKSLVAALNYGRYLRVISELKGMVEANLPERKYQSFLEENYWIFGSEYSELLPERTLVLGDQLDFPLRRTVDGYLDVIEIKTPLNGDCPFLLDKDHNSYYLSSDVSKAIGQLEKYLADLEANQQSIELLKKLKVEKVRGKVVIGRDGNDRQMEYLRRSNAGRNAVQVITFDQLIRIGERILEIMTDENPILEAIKIEQVLPTSITNTDEF